MGPVPLVALVTRETTKACDPIAHAAQKVVKPPCMKTTMDGPTLILYRMTTGKNWLGRFSANKSQPARSNPTEFLS